MRHFIIAITLLVATLPVHAESFDHSRWGSLLNKHVVPINQGVATEVDYHSFLKNRFLLKEYLNSLAAVSADTFECWPKDDRLAFLINAYNAWTVELILTEYPNLESIKALGSWFKSPWDKRFIPLLGETRSLDEIEHGLIRAEGSYEAPRIHFAVNCASIGCPALLANAFSGENLKVQLEEATHLFLSDRSRNKLAGDTLYLSKIFKWYQKDFERGWGGFHRLEQFIATYQAALALSDRDIQRLNTGAIEIEFLDYDWSLNRKR